MLSALAKTLFGSENDRVLKKMQASVDAINALEPEVHWCDGISNLGFFIIFILWPGLGP